MSPRFDTPPPGSPSFLNPRPRPRKSPEQSARIRVQNRRREYLERYPDYFKSLDHELADPLLYDTLVRRFQSTAEREAEGRAKGYGRILEGSLARSEERRERTAQSVVRQESAMPNGSGGDSQVLENMSLKSASAAPDFALDIELAPPPKTKEEGGERWRAFLGDRFIRGGDGDFEYSCVDENEDYDVMERQEQQDAWFDDEAPGWADEDHGSATDAGAELDGKGQRMAVDKILYGETGIQDF
ncbi:hypothetical protein GQ53DRAFT_400484 [Thozetella sp. PMI_491]|nr:hypothetical protein GQ53DRAFT_400484 [Thozetella sp. PMI_491]